MSDLAHIQTHPRLYTLLDYLKVDQTENEDAILETRSNRVFLALNDMLFYCNKSYLG